MALRCVPFNAAWISHDKIDIHAIYRRPRFVMDDYGEWQREFKDGQPTWDLTGPLPVRSHNRWIAKGFEYVTLANKPSLYIAARFGTLPPETTIKDFDQHQTGGPWSLKKYMEGIVRENTERQDQMRRDVYKFGSDVVEHFEKQKDPGFELPPDLRDIAPGQAEFPVVDPTAKLVTAKAKAQKDGATA